MLTRPPAVIIAGTHSGCGKTTFTLGLMAALKRRGMKVAPFKIGPDFIDPGLHSLVCNTPSHNLDGWILSKEANEAIFESGMNEADIGIVEGVMGLYDGARGDTDIGSTAHIAKLLTLPIILVADAKSMARSIRALLKGYIEFDDGIEICGIILNKVGSKKHKAILLEATYSMDIPFIGFLEKDESIEIPSRHLGLKTAEDLVENSAELFDSLAEFIENSIDLDRLIKIIRTSCNKRKPAKNESEDHRRLLTTHTKNSGVTIAIARDSAFCFYYQRNIDILEMLGANIVPFSPLKDQRLPHNIHGLYLGGGYPELYARELSLARDCMEEIVNLAEKGLPILAECGGFMFLNKGLWDEYEFFQWTGLFPLEFKMAKRFQALGYRAVLLEEDCVLGRAGTQFKGHEFRYSMPIATHEDNYATHPFKAMDAMGQDTYTPGFAYKNCFASYVHIHFDSNIHVAISFLNACEEFSRK